MNLQAYALTVVLLYSIHALVATGVNLVAGYGGRLTLAHGAIFGAGAYAYALVTLAMPLGGWLVGLGLAIVIGAVLTLPLSLMERRLRGDFFVIATLALQALVLAAFKNWHTSGVPVGTWVNLTNGMAGIPGVPRPEWAASLAGLALLSVVVAALLVWACAILVGAPWGRLLRASRDDRLVAEGLGKPVLRVRMQAFALSGALAALGGGLYAAYASYVSPDVGSLDQSVMFLTMVLVGGAGTVRGPLIGAGVLLGIQEGLRLFRVAELLRDLSPVVPTSLTDANLQALVYGLLLLLLIRTRPQGIAGDRLAV